MTTATKGEKSTQGGATGTTSATAPKSERSEARAFYNLAFSLQASSPDCASAPGIDYERMSQRVQGGVKECDIPAGYGRGHVRADPVEARIATMTGRPLRTARWLRSFGPAQTWLDAAHADKLGCVLDACCDAVADAAAIARWSDAPAVEASEGVTAKNARKLTPRERLDARRAYARAALREAWAVWYREAW